jgi:antitoxin component of MazEF toxin-antitoxin module
VIRDTRNIVKHGNTGAVTIPRAFLHRLNWIFGQTVIIELTDDCQSIVVRQPRADDFGLRTPPHLVSTLAEVGK